MQGVGLVSKSSLHRLSTKKLLSDGSAVEKKEWREGTRGEAVHGVKQLLASACWRMVKTWLRAVCHWCALIRIISAAGSCVASYPGSLGEGKKRAWYLLFAHALNYLTFQSFWISPGTSVLCDVTSQLAAL